MNWICGVLRKLREAFAAKNGNGAQQPEHAVERTAAASPTNLTDAQLSLDESPAVPRRACADLEVADAELIARLIFEPDEINPRKFDPKDRVFRPGTGSAILSVFRSSAVRVNHVRSIVLKSNPKTGRRCRGAWVAPAGELRRLGLIVTDDRSEYLGHAHVEFPIATPLDDNPLADTALVALSKKLTRQLKELAKFVPDKAPASSEWVGAEIEFSDVRSDLPLPEGVIPG